MARHDSIPRGEIEVKAEEWGEGVDFSVLDPRIAKIGAAWLAKQYKLSHVKESGNLTPTRPDGVIRWMYVQVNSASSDDIRLRKTGEIKQLVKVEDCLCYLGEWVYFPLEFQLHLIQL